MSFAICLAALLSAATVHGAEHAHATGPGVQSLDVYADDIRVHLLTGELHDGNEKPLLFYTRSNDGGATWLPRVRVDQGRAPGFALHRGMDAQIAAAGDQIIAAWTSAGTDKWGSGPITISISNDGGKTWHASTNPADDRSTSGHGFIDIAADHAGTVHLTWLDSRDGKQGLRYTRSTDGGRTWSPNATLKAATCECCSNAVATNADGTVAILFRDGHPRDMNVTVSMDGGQRWCAPARLGDFRWQFDGCPHVGGGLSFGRETLHAAVWSGKTGATGVYHFVSANSGVTWSKPRRLGMATASHPNIAVSRDQSVAAVWDEQRDGQSSVWAAVSSDGGNSWNEPVQLSDRAANATHPLVIATQTSFRTFWTEDRGDRPTGWVSKLLP